MSDLYKTLGIDKTSDKTKIKKAYRKSAKKHHPDRGGDAKTFALVKKAHDILMDDDRRNKYDQTGEESEKHPDNSFSNIMNCIGFHFNAVLNDCANSGQSPLTIDMVSRVRSKINSSMNETHKNLRVAKTVLNFDKKMKGRFKSKTGQNVFEDIVSHRIVELEMSISHLDGNIKTHEQALEIIKECSYHSDGEPYESPGDRMMRLMGASF